MKFGYRMIAKATACATGYHPPSGSGSPLLKAAAEAGKPITLEDQKKDATTDSLPRIT